MQYQSKLESNKHHEGKSPCSDWNFFLHCEVKRHCGKGGTEYIFFTFLCRMKWAIGLRFASGPTLMQYLNKETENILWSWPL